MILDISAIHYPYFAEQRQEERLEIRRLYYGGKEMKLTKFGVSVALISAVAYFAGGEPMLMKEHWYILNKLVELKRFDVILKYTINCSTLSYAGKNAIDYWNLFDKKQIRITNSIDDIGQRLEYQRNRRQMEHYSRKSKNYQ
jgi:hypothetical protein